MMFSGKNKPEEKKPEKKEPVDPKLALAAGYTALLRQHLPAPAEGPPPPPMDALELSDPLFKCDACGLQNLELVKHYTSTQKFFEQLANDVRMPSYGDAARIWVHALLQRAQLTGLYTPPK